MEDYSAYTDQRLIELLADEDRLAYTEIYNRYWPVLFAHAYKMLKNHDAARDIIQDIFTDLWMQASGLQIKHSIRAYLYAMVRFKVLDVIRRNLHYEKHLDSLATFAEKAEFNTDNTIIFNEFVKRIDDEVAQLPDRMREIFQKSRFEGLSNKEIAEDLNISHETVKKTITRALKILRSKLRSFILIWF
ncbi:RNA polymerase sigma-70 factor, ECF subfamily [Parapedobacter composti]|uniref:RNA polymerase sigma-70 factor, ECF subfamily n=1 Tax=Parapedobacter composti TaxID=623281 RepID=A0A1I1JA32_9SPHI|nr:RNA polymerase sigma-70 factor [Parapedobacter composti]SFC45414.1 RNA polymerase sigma-70 factor, ECF subfamily [Parapedobacter composti]